MKCEKEMWVCLSQRQLLSGRKEGAEILFLFIAQIRVGKPPGRIEPRAVKTQTKKFRGNDQDQPENAAFLLEEVCHRNILLTDLVGAKIAGAVISNLDRKLTKG
ncbi:MAG: hypothetical protein P8Y45_18110 [Exilibacterium sp.]